MCLSDNNGLDRQHRNTVGPVDTSSYFLFKDKYSGHSTAVPNLSPAVHLQYQIFCARKVILSVVNFRHVTVWLWVAYVVKLMKVFVCECLSVCSLWHTLNVSVIFLCIIPRISYNEFIIYTITLPMKIHSLHGTSKILTNGTLRCWHLFITIFNFFSDFIYQNTLHICFCIHNLFVRVLLHWRL